MRFAVESWAPEYGSPMDVDDLGAARADVDAGVEVAVEDWAPRVVPPDTPRPESVLFADGVRRVDARVWLTDETGAVRSGICASYAAGAVRCDGRAEVVAATVERGVFTAAADPDPIETQHGRFEPRPVGDSPQAQTIGLQARMGGLEIDVIAALAGRADLVVVDGPLRGVGRYPPGAVGYIKTHDARYLPEPLDAVIGQLGPGERTPLFRFAVPLQTKWSWYLRLPGADGHPWAGIVRCETAADRPVEDAVALADTTVVALPRFASRRHKDPRAPQNLIPIGGLERRLRHVLGDPDLIFRGLARAARVDRSRRQA